MSGMCFRVEGSLELQMRKVELCSQLENARNNFVLGLAANSLFVSQDALPILKRSHAQFGAFTVEFAQVAELLRERGDREIALKEFLKVQMRALVKEIFEVIKEYCVATGQAEQFKSLPFYEFSRIIRNCLSHNFKFTFYKNDKKLLPVKWRSKEINLGMEGAELELGFFGLPEAWELFLDFQNFVEERLT